MIIFNQYSLSLSNIICEEGGGVGGVNNFLPLKEGGGLFETES